MNRDMDMAMDRKYYRVKHKIDFYLKINNEEDCSKYRFNLEHNSDDENYYSINIIRWDYADISKPDKAMLKLIKTNSGFIYHRNKNLLLHKEKFILKICLNPGEYDKDMIIYDKYKSLPYLWFIQNSVNSEASNTTTKFFTVVDSVIQLNVNVVFVKKSYFYIKCYLFPIKEIMKNNTIKFISSASPIDTSTDIDTVTKVKVKASSNAVASKADTEEIKPKKLYEHPDPIIAKKGDPWSKDAARFKNNNKPKVK